LLATECTWVPFNKGGGGGGNITLKIVGKTTSGKKTPSFVVFFFGKIKKTNILDLVARGLRWFFLKRGGGGVQEQ